MEPSDHAVAQFVERLGSVLTASGLPAMPSRVFAALLADEDGSMTSAELAQALAVSPAAISGAVRYLTQLRMIRRERDRTPGSRRDVYIVLDDAWHDMVSTNGVVYRSIRDAMATGIEPVGGAGTRAGARLSLSVEFLEFVEAEMSGLGRRWEEHKSATGRTT